MKFISSLRPWPFGLALIFSPVVRAAEIAATSATLATDIARMARIGSCFSPSFSPDARTIAFVSTLSGSPQIWTVQAAGGWPTQVTAFDDQVNAVSWSPAGDWLAFTMAPGGGLNNQVYLIRPDGSGLRRLTPGGKVNCSFYSWTRDGRFVTLGTNERDAAAIDAYLFEMGTGKQRLVRQNKGIGGVDTVSTDNRFAVVSVLASRGRNDLHLVDLASGRQTLLTPFEGPGTFGAAFAADGRTLFMFGNQNRDTIALFRARVNDSGEIGGWMPVAERGDAELENVVLDDQGKRAVLAWNVGGQTELAFLDLANGRAQPIAALPGEIVSVSNFSRDGAKLVVTARGARRPADVWTLDIANGKFLQVTQSPHAGIDLDALVTPKLVRFPAKDGLELSAWLYVPKNFAAPGRVVMSFHGGPEGQERPAFNSTYQALLAQGIAVIAPNVRGSSGFGKKFVNLDNGPLRVNGVQDIAATIDYLVSSGLAAPKRVGITGGSYGGYMVMAGLTEFPGRIAAGVNLFGIVNFETFFAHTEPWMAAISTVEYGDPVKEPDLLKRLSPINKIDRIVAPTLVQHGVNDTNVPFVEAEQVVNALKAKGVPTELVSFSDEGHGFRKTPNRVRSAVTLVEWFVKYL